MRSDQLYESTLLDPTNSGLAKSGLKQIFFFFFLFYQQHKTDDGVKQNHECIDNFVAGGEDRAGPGAGGGEEGAGGPHQGPQPADRQPSGYARQGAACQRRPFRVANLTLTLKKWKIIKFLELTYNVFNVK